MSDWPQRTMCDVLEEMKKCSKNLNFAPVMGLIEEAQMIANRMEAGLLTLKDKKKLLDEIKKLKEERDEIKKELPEKETTDDEHLRNVLI